MSKNEACYNQTKQRKDNQMTFEEIKPLIDRLSKDDIERLNDYLQQQLHIQPKAMDIDAVLAGAKAIRESMSEEELDEMLMLMNEEYIEDVDDNLWDK
jgi:uncharacterized protein YeeX (DUF496 family)